ncbi:unnamed protein product [Mytilus edulis]|uniref:Fucolectin tachylectin-4 pentraxin-1 domain-containing protein n=1 Tax=Mytilus edulis TaxID=6550 RepID=A0A8S3QIW4_MYTED|nr:unnamed protein product [Mytilus edulis]
MDGGKAQFYREAQVLQRIGLKSRVLEQIQDGGIFSADFDELGHSNLSSIKQVAKRLLEWPKGRTFNIFPFQFAVDGRLDTIQHTKKQYLPYWVVDIGTIYNTERVEIYNEPDCCGERLRNLDIIIGISHNAMNLCAHYAGPSHTADHLVFKCGGVLPGRYVKLMIRKTEYLHVAEVKVFARM